MQHNVSLTPLFQFDLNKAADAQRSMQHTEHYSLSTQQNGYNTAYHSQDPYKFLD